MTLYDSRKRLECCEFETPRFVGVRVSRPFKHHGRNRELYADMSYERPTVNSACYGSNKPIEEINEEVIAMTEHVIEKLDLQITELMEHRARLDTELRNVVTDPPIDVEQIQLGELPLFGEKQCQN